MICILKCFGPGASGVRSINGSHLLDTSLSLEGGIVNAALPSERTVLSLQATRIVVELASVADVAGTARRDHWRLESLFNSHGSF